MADKRIYQIAKELNISHSEIIKFLETKDIKVSNHMMPVDNSVYAIILMEFSKEKKQVERILKEKARQAIVTTKKTIKDSIPPIVEKKTITIVEKKSKPDIKKDIRLVEKKKIEVVPEEKKEVPKHNLKKVDISKLQESSSKKIKTKGTTKKLNIADSLSKLNKTSRKKIKKKSTQEIDSESNESKIIKVPEFLTVDELSKMMMNKELFH